MAWQAKSSPEKAVVNEFIGWKLPLMLKPPKAE
jgi:hypothetical protein